MGIAEQEHAGIPVNFPLQVFKIKAIAVISYFQRIFSQFAPGAPNRLKKREINRRLNHYLLSCLRQGQDGDCQG